MKDQYYKRIRVIDEDTGCSELPRSGYDIADEFLRQLFNEIEILMLKYENITKDVRFKEKMFRMEQTIKE